MSGRLRAMKVQVVAVILCFSPALIATPQEHPPYHVWKPNNSCCTLKYVDGVPFERYVETTPTGRFSIEVRAPQEHDKHIDTYGIIVANFDGSTSSLDVNPMAMAAQAENADHTKLQVIDADVMLAKEERSKKRKNSFATGLSAMGTTGTASTTYSDGTSSTTTYSDPSAAGLAGQIRSDKIKDRYAQYAATVLRRNTLAPGQVVGGFVYFERPKGLDKKAPAGTIAVTISGMVYIFPFPNGQVPNSAGEQSLIERMALLPGTMGYDQ
jgi:hypothetical protein